METKDKNRNPQMKILIVEDQFIEAHDLQLILENAGYYIIGVARSFTSAIDLIEKEKPDLVFVDIFLKGEETGIDLAKKLRELHIGFIYLSANSSRAILDEAKKTQPYGFIVKPFRAQDVLITLEIASYRHHHGIESHLQQEEILTENIEAIGFAPLKLEQALEHLVKILQTYIPFDFMQAEFMEDECDSIGLLRKNFDSYELIDIDRFSKITGLKKQELCDLKTTSQKHYSPFIYQGEAFQSLFQNSPFKRIIIETFGIKSILSMPIRVDEHNVFNFFFCSRDSENFTNSHLSLLMKLEGALAKLIKDKDISQRGKPNAVVSKKKLVIVEDAFEGFDSMVGKSKEIITVFDYIKKVAPSETSVLILGESGTGKEKVAHSIHNLSKRKDMPLVIINCGAIPDNLAESLLFGHEKGAFTGALDKRIGKFELADGGTIFLDEIGELPMNLQVKLLRVLQEKEIERIGGKQPIKVNVRIIAATNRSLEEEVASGRFRLDLYYRLHVFPITVPPLRERKDDIPNLISHFIKTFSDISGIEAPKLSNDALDQMLSYHWPGNIRELEHVIQRNILLTDSNMIKEIVFSSPSKATEEEKPQEFSIKSIHDNERDYISYILKKCKGKVSGAGGAAEILNIPASTLNSKMKKLGIKSRFI